MHIADIVDRNRHTIFGRHSQITNAFEILLIPFCLHDPLIAVLYNDPPTRVVVVFSQDSCDILDTYAVFDQVVVVHHHFVSRDKSANGCDFTHPVHTHKRVFVVIILQSS